MSRLTFCLVVVSLVAGCMQPNLRPNPPAKRQAWEYITVHCQDPRTNNYYTLALPQEYAKCDDKDEQISAAEYEARPRIGAQSPSDTSGTDTPAVSRKISTGTGFVINPTGMILTNDHVIDECTNVTVRFGGSDPLAASIIARDPQNDLALLKMPSWSGTVARFREGGPVRPGDSVVAFGFPLQGRLSSTGNVTTGSVTALAGLGDDARYLQVSAPVQPGNSGGPLLDLSGNVIGVIVSKLTIVRMGAGKIDIPQNVNFAIKTAVARAFLELHNVKIATAPMRTRLDAADVADLARVYTGIIECYATSR